MSPGDPCTLIATSIRLSRSLTHANCSLCSVLVPSSTVLDLPYRFGADDTKMRLDRAFNMNNIMSKLGSREAIACCACIAFMLLSGD